ncbi:hypothetical protein B0T17DRAFT_530676 [Bombardia bombarda]|uniref:Uncharacterized protein n=1 Tax=Bombardia bombarda TaxID=252184 RepID=A0AA39WZU7_9PEZI|nr:hypothetical protein B0T17DRAFT_530676 [Bombardia bombarda]
MLGPVNDERIFGTLLLVMACSPGEAAVETLRLTYLHEPVHTYQTPVCQPTLSGTVSGSHMRSRSAFADGPVRAVGSAQTGTPGW